jgi:hypothetical protein
MAETFVENLVCGACRADVRPRALFCYHCGASVDSKVEGADKNGIAKNADLFIDIISDGDKTKSKKSFPEAVPVAKVVNEKTSKKVFSKEDLPEKANLKSAASLRRKTRAIQPKKVEISWEARENAPNIWFAIAALGLTLFAVGVLFLALQFR